MQESKKELLQKIKKSEQKLAKDAQDKALLKELLSDFEKLLHIDSGPLVYIDATTQEDLQTAYKIDTEESFDVLERKNIELKNAGNPNNYLWMPDDIKLVVIENTPKNKKLAQAMVRKITSAIKLRLKYGD
jgi:hypothetical protein